MTQTPTSNCDACVSIVTDEPPTISNRPGLAALSYRIGTYASFRRAMLARIPYARVEDRTPLANWTSRRADDFGIALIAMWAYLADILTFYQERTANEAFLRTALQPESLRRLAALLDYRPAQGKAAVTYLAFTLKAPTPSLPEVNLPAGLRAQSVPGQDERPQKFESAEARKARAAWNRLAPVTRQPQSLSNSSRIYLAGRVGGLRPGDAVLVLNLAHQGGFQTITAVAFTDDQTVVSLAESFHHTGDEPGVYLCRRAAALFGHNAPDPQNLPLLTQHALVGNTVRQRITTTATGPDDNRTITTTTEYVVVGTETPLLHEWDFTTTPGKDQIDLDGEYPEIVPGRWVVLVAGINIKEYKVTAAAIETRTNFTLVGKITRLTLDSQEYLNVFKNATRSTTVYLAATDSLTLGELPVTTPFNADYLEVLGDHSELERGRPLLLVGTSGGAPAQELVFVQKASYKDSTGVTTLLLTAPLVAHYEREGLMIYANVVRATHGESVHETLGSGNAEPFQTFALQKAPVTYVPQAGASGGVASTLEVRVNGVRWDEARSFYGVTPNAPTFTTVTDSAGTTTVRFGDGFTGQRLPTGRSNISAVYRQGIGRAGNVRPGTITTLLDRVAGVKGAVNPIGAGGGADPEQLEQVRANAPNTVRTFGRIVSLRDFEDAARDIAGIAKARAAIIWEGEDQIVQLTVAGDEGDAVSPGTAAYNDLLADLNSRRDPNRHLSLRSYEAAPVELGLSLTVDSPRYLPNSVRAAVRQRLLAHFAFANLNLGQPVQLSDLYRVIHDEPGVITADLDRFGFKSYDPCPPGASNAAWLRLLDSRGSTGMISTADNFFPDLIQTIAVPRSSQLLTLADADLTILLPQVEAAP